jgi:hypothetical protein
MVLITAPLSRGGNSSGIKGSFTLRLEELQVRDNYGAPITSHGFPYPGWWRRNFRGDGDGYPHGFDDSGRILEK